jgi:hypothetical protein
MTSEAGDFGGQLAPFDQALWQLAESPDLAGGLSSAAVIRDCTLKRGSSLTAWALIEESARDEFALDRLATLPRVEARWLGDARLFRDDDPRGPFVFAAVPAPFDGVVWLLTSISATDERWRRLSRWVRRSIHTLSPVFLNEEDFLAVGDALSQYGPVETSRLTARDLRDGSSYTRGWPEHRRGRPTHREALREARRLSVRTLTLHVGERLLVQLRRVAGATFYSGDYGVFENVVLLGLGSAAAERRRLLTGRARQLNVPPPRPLGVRTRGGTFSEREAITDLLDVLERQPATGVAVFHRNPYLHAAVTDYADGSNFDVFVTEANELVIIPGYAATARALGRLTDAVGERFAAVEIAEVETPTPPTMSDFLGAG